MYHGTQTTVNLARVDLLTRATTELCLGCPLRNQVIRDTRLLKNISTILIKGLRQFISGSASFTVLLSVVCFTTARVSNS